VAGSRIVARPPKANSYHPTQLPINNSYQRAGAPSEAQIISVSTFVAHLRELGYFEGQNLVIEFRHADTQDRLRELTTELVELGVQVIYATNPYALRCARDVTTTPPIVGYDYESDPVAVGYAASFARPGGNVTGVFLDQASVSAKQVQLLKEVVPGLSRAAVLWGRPARHGTA